MRSKIFKGLFVLICTLFSGCASEMADSNYWFPDCASDGISYHDSVSAVERCYGRATATKTSTNSMTKETLRISRYKYEFKESSTARAWGWAICEGLTFMLCNIVAVPIEKNMFREPRERIVQYIDGRVDNGRSFIDDSDINATLTKITSQLSKNIPQKSTIATDVQSYDANAAQYVREQLEIMLMNKGYRIVERANLDKVRKELNVQMGDDFNERSAASLGYFSGANMIIVGIIDNGNKKLNRFRFRAIDVETGTTIAITSEEI